ncbi:hypothetical protein NFI96_009668, partial [Prochilodus magdalenae]
MPDGGSAKAAMSTAVVNGHTSPANALTETSQTPVSDNSSSKNLFIYILLLLLGLGGVGVIYWRCRGRRQGQAESQDQRRMKREQEAQVGEKQLDVQIYSTTETKPRFSGTSGLQELGCTLENREQLLTITAHTGGSVLLPCSCTDLQTKPEEFSWKRPKGEPPKPKLSNGPKLQLSTTPKPAPSTAVVNVKTSPTTRPTPSTTPSSPSADEPPLSLPFVPFALVTVILLHIIVAVVYYTRRTKGCTLENSKQQLQDKQPLRITAHTGGTVPATPLQRCSNGVCVVRAYIADTPGAARWPDQHGAFWGLEFRAVVPPERRRCGRPLLAAGQRKMKKDELKTQ